MFVSIYVVNLGVSKRSSCSYFDSLLSHHWRNFGLIRPLVPVSLFISLFAIGLRTDVLSNLCSGPFLMRIISITMPEFRLDTCKVWGCFLRPLSFHSSCCFVLMRPSFPSYFFASVFSQDEAILANLDLLFNQTIHSRCRSPRLPTRSST